MKVLIADDELIYLKIVEKMIRGWGYDVVQVTDGNKAWDVLEHDSSIHIAMLDWMMPGIDGLELTRRVRARDGMPYVAIIVLSARDSQEDIDQGYQAGVDDYLVKPINSIQLRQRLAVAERVVKMEREARNTSEIMTRLVSTIGNHRSNVVVHERGEVNLLQALNMALASSKYAVRPHVTIQTDFPSELPKILGNPDRLEEIFVQLILDSSQWIKRKGKGNLVINAGSTSSMVSVTIQDNAPRGEGVSIASPAVLEIQESLQAQGGDLLIEQSTLGGVCYTVRFPVHNT
jgi:DNA-binding response OmpR family regulator